MSKTKTQAFSPGDIVKLKSGGPDMTVKDRSYGDYRCQWFAGKKLESGSFPSESLEIVDTKEEQ